MPKSSQPSRPKRTTAKRSKRLQSRPADVPITQIVLDEVASGLRAEDLADIFKKSLHSLLELGDTLIVDLELTAELSALTKERPIVILGHPIQRGPLTADEAIQLLDGAHKWLDDLEGACDVAWTRAFSPHDRGLFRKPLQLLRGILVDLKHGSPTIWTQLSSRAPGERFDDTYVSAVKAAAAQALSVLMSCKMKSAPAYAIISAYVTEQAKVLGNSAIPLPTRTRLQRLKSSVEPVASEPSEQQAKAIVELLMGDAVRKYLTAPRPESKTERSR